MAAEDGEVAAGFTVTPWEVSGKVDYDKLVRLFGTTPIDKKLLERLKKHSNGTLHPFLKRKLFFSHRDLDVLLDGFEKNGEKFALYTGRGPSGRTTIGHLIPWMFTKYLQDTFNAELYFQLTDDEKFLIKDGLTIEDVIAFTQDNALDVVACGFDPKKTRIFADTEYIKTLYKTAISVAKKITFSTAKAVFGFKNDSNIGIIFFPAIQAAPAFLPSIIEGKPVPVLIPCAIDQDPYWRIARDVAPKLGFPKPAAIHSKFIPSLGSGGKMSASIPETSIFTTDSEDVARKKVMNAFSGGQATVAEQKKLGGNPEVCSAFQYFVFLFENDDAKLGVLESECRSGRMVCGDCKKMLADRVCKFLNEHQERREKAKDVINDFMVRD